MREHGLVLGTPEFERIQAEIRASGRPSTGDDLLGMMIDTAAYLGDPAYSAASPVNPDRPWARMSAETSTTGEWLITARGTGRREDALDIAAALARVWEERLRYTYRSAHTVVTAADSVTLYGVTQIGHGDFWVTTKVQIDLT